MRFAVSLSLANKLLRRQGATGSVSALPLRSSSVLGRSRHECLLACLTARPDATLAETGQVLVAAGGPLPGLHGHVVGVGTTGLGA